MVELTIEYKGISWQFEKYLVSLHRHTLSSLAMSNMITTAEPQGSIVLYTTPDGVTQLDVKLENETVWLTREQIAVLFERDYKTIAKHINNA